MKYIYSLIIICLCFFESYSQRYDTTHHVISSGILVPQHLCAGDSVYIVYDYSRANNFVISSIDTYLKWLNPYECRPYNSYASLDYRRDNNSLKWEVNGTYRVDPNNPYAIWAKLTSSGSVKLSGHYGTYVPANFCQISQADISSFSGISRRIIVVQKPSNFEISADKATLRFPESTFIRGSGCPNTLLSENIPQSSSKIHWSFGCIINGNPTIPSIVITDNTGAIGAGSGSTYGSYGINRVFAKCNDNGCMSLDYAETIYSLQSARTGDATVLKIDSINKASNRTDYHYYETEKEICTTSEGNPNCTKQKVLDLLLSSKANQGPVAADFIGLGGSDGKVGLFGSKLIYASDDSPITNGNEVNLPGPISMIVGAVLLVRTQNIQYSGKKIRRSLLNSTQTNSRKSNPIRMLVDNDSFSVTNYTLPGHFLYPGKVIRSVVEDCGKIKIITLGVGYSWLHDYPYYDEGGNPVDLGVIMGSLNTFFGKVLFRSIDNRVKNTFDNLPR